MTQRQRRSAASELTLARGAALACAGVAVPVLAIAALLHGLPGVVGAGAGIGLALVAFAGAGVLADWARRFGPGTWAGVVSAGVAARLVFYIVALQALGGVSTLHRPSLAIATFCATVVSMAYEIRLVSSDPRYFWVHTARGVTR